MTQTPREVRLRTIVEVARRSPSALRMGISFTLISIPIFLLFALVIPEFDDDVPETNYEQITAEGVATTATVTDIKTQFNVTISNQHPSIISYRYQVDGRVIDDRFKTLDADKVSRLNIGDELPIRHYNGKSVISSLEPFGFPSMLFMLSPGVLVIVGLICLIYVWFISKDKIYLYRHGAVADAEVLAVHPAYGRGVTVHYQYKKGHQTYLGESFERDVSLASTLKNGDQVKIFVAPKNPSLSTLVSRLEAARNNWAI